MSEHIEIPRRFRYLVERQCAAIGPVESDDDCAKLVKTMLNVSLPLCELIDALHPDNRPTLLLHEGDVQRGIPTVWLLGWSAEESTTPHDHGESEGAIVVLRGTVADQGYTCGPDHHMRECKDGGLPVYTIDRRYLAGTVVTMPHEYVHDMFGRSNNKDRRDVTVHAYWPPLIEMGYFKTSDEHHLVHTRVWRKEPQDQRKETPST